MTPATLALVIMAFAGGWLLSSMYDKHEETLFGRITETFLVSMVLLGTMVIAVKVVM